MKPFFLSFLLIATATFTSAQNCKLISVLNHFTDGDTISYITFTYDKGGKLETWLEKSAYINVLYGTYYDSDGRILDYTDTDADAAPGESAVYTHRLFYENDKLTMVIDFDDLMVSKSMRTFGYDKHGYMIALKNFEIGYDDTTQTSVSEYRYNDKGDAIEIESKDGNDDIYISKITYDDKKNPYYHIGYPEYFDLHNVLSHNENTNGEVDADYSYTNEIGYNEEGLPMIITTKDLEGNVISISDFVYSCD